MPHDARILRVRLLADFCKCASSPFATVHSQLEARDLLENSTWNVTKATVLYKRRRAPKASDREFSTDDAKQCAASIVAASGLFAGLMAILASFPPATI